MPVGRFATPSSYVSFRRPIAADLHLDDAVRDLGTEHLDERLPHFVLHHLAATQYSVQNSFRKR